MAMKRFFWTITLMVSCLTASGQQTEFAVQAGSGLFGFRSPGAASETTLHGNDVASLPYILGNSYGRSSGLSYSLAGQVQRVAQGRLVYGIQIGYESLESRIPITRYIGGFSLVETPADGRATLRNQFINLHPFFGKRFGKQRLSLDATAGVDVGFILSEHEFSELRYNGSYYTTTDRDRPAPTVDVRPRLNLTGYYRAFGLSIGYAQGLTNYVSTMFTDRKAYTRMWRVGLVYRLAKPI